MKYFVRALKYFAAFCVLYLAIVWLSVMTTKGMDVSAWDYIVANFQTTRGKLLGLAVVVLSAAYPRMGFMTRRVECDMEDERDYLLQVFAASGFTLKEESEGRMVFRADNILSRLFLLFEDEITVEQYGQWIDITGIRRGVARVLYRAWRR
ncbi:MAG: hypothetical protein II217_07010 [Alistipes sp.]|jgi:hypothetical protein|nr:hypothetical protein [Alistipes sp.]MBR5483888.1 hypothetical protein [Alistipes sp.]